MKNINFKHPKYVLPLILLIPLIFIAYQVTSAINFEVEEKVIVQTKGSINMDMPTPNMENLELKSKYKNMMDNYNRMGEYSAIQNIEMEEKESVVSEQIYTDLEIAVMDSTAEAQRLQIGELEKLKSEVEKAHNVENNQPNDSPINQIDPSTKAMMEQMALVQKIANGETIKNTEEELEEMKRKELLEKERKAKELAGAPSEVIKADGIKKRHFNTIGKKDKESKLIKAMLDEKIKIIDGSRIRIRLMDDIVINDIHIEKGTYIYALVSGFGAQRVRAKVESMLVNDKHIKVSLNIYDNDGIEGFYVPASAFRDLTKEAGAQAMAQSINMNSNSSEQNFESFAFQTLQGIYQSTTSAISKNIKKNKATLKYNTEVYLINE